jgi:predicted ATPase
VKIPAAGQNDLTATPPCDVYNSHATADKALADASCAALEAAGIPCWIAPRNIRPGEEWPDAIQRGIEACRLMLILLTRDAMTSEWVKKEITGAASKRMKLLTVRLTEQLPTGGLHFLLSVNQWLDASTGPFETHVPTMTAGVKAMLEAVQGATQAEVAAQTLAQELPLLPPMPSATHFVGREEDLTRLRDRLADTDGAIIAVVGAPGVGKSRLALELARQLHRERQDLCRDGTLFVDAEGVPDAASLSDLLLRRLGLSGEAVNSPATARDRLLTFLEHKRLLFVLDRVDEVDGVYQFLRDVGRDARSGGVRFLTTTRRWTGEPDCVYALDPLKGPPEKPNPVAAEPREAVALRRQELRDNPAVRLFADQATRKWNRFELTDDNVEDVAEVCRRADGLPLAIELLAASLRTNPLKELIDALASVPALDRAVDQSVRRLARTPRSVLYRLSVFRGSFDAYAAERVCAVELARQRRTKPPRPPLKSTPPDGHAHDNDDDDYGGGGGGGGGGGTPDDHRSDAAAQRQQAMREFLTARVATKTVRRALDTLLRHSLVTDQGHAGATQRRRWSILETIRSRVEARATRQLGASGMMALRRAHAAYVLTAARRTRTRPPDGALEWEAVDADRANVAAAYQFAKASGNGRLAAHLAGLVCPILARRGHWHERLGLADAAYQVAAAVAVDTTATPSHRPPRRAVIELMHQIANAHLDRCEWHECERWLRQCLSAWADLGNACGEARAMNRLSLVAERREDLDEAERLATSAMQKLEGQTGAQRQRSEILNNLGSFAQARGEILVGSGDAACAPPPPDDIPQAARSHFTRAERCYEQSLEICRAIGDRLGVARMLNNLATLAQWRRRPLRAFQLYEQSRAAYEAAGERGLAVTVMFNLACAAAACGRPGDARSLASESLAAARSLSDGHDENMAKSLWLLGKLAKDGAHYQEAYEHLSQAKPLIEKIAGPQKVIEELANLADVCRKLGRDAEARELMLEAKDRVVSIGHPETREQLATLLERHEASGGG